MKRRNSFWTKVRRTYVTADTHFGDAIAFAKFKRPFASLAEMDEALLAGINRRVGPRDLLLHVGDVFGEREWDAREKRRARALRDRIVCRQIVLVAGNTDPTGERWFDGMFDERHDILTWKGWPGEEKTRVVACHYPMRQWQGWPSGAVHIYGHVHGSLSEEGRSTDVGVDCSRYEPIELAPLLDSLRRRPFVCPTKWPRRQTRVW